MDAVRERSFPEETAPAPDSWEAISRRVRRGTAWRRSGLAAAVLLPVAALSVWLFRQQPDIPAAQIVQTTEAPVMREPDISPAPETPTAGMEAGRPVTHRPGRSLPAKGSQEAAPTAPEEAPRPPAATIQEDETPRSAPEASPQPVPEPLPPVPARRYRPRLTAGFHLGAAPAGRQGVTPARSEAYIASLSYMNAMLTPGSLSVKSNASNTIGYIPLANQYLSGTSPIAYRHDLPLSLGLSVRVGLTRRLAVETGVEYTYLHSLASYGLDGDETRLDQRLHFLGIPLRLDAALWTRGGLTLYAGAGVLAEKCLAASMGAVACEERRIQWSANAFAGVQYRLWSRTSFYFQPEVSRYFTQTDLVTYYTENPLGFSIQAGLRFDL